MKQFVNRNKQTIRRFILYFTLFSFSMITLGIIYYYQSRQHFRLDVQKELSAITEAKSDILTQWANERMRDGQILLMHKQLPGMIWRGLTVANATQLRIQIDERLQQIQDIYKYDAVFLIDTLGELVDWDTSLIKIHQSHIDHLDEMLRTREVSFVDFHRENSTTIYLEVIVPLFQKKESPKAFAAIVLRTNPEAYLYPLLNKYPMFYHSGETILVRREGNKVVFLNKLKYGSAPLLSFSVAMTKTDLPAAMAIEGKQGIVEGVDYRGIAVIAYLKAIPDLPWFILTKVDKDEIYSPLHERVNWVIGSVVLILLVMAIGLLSTWRDHQMTNFKERVGILEELQENEQSTALLLESIRDGVIATDNDGKITSMNPVAAHLTNWAVKDALGQDLANVFKIVDTQTHAPKTPEVTPNLHTVDLLKFENHFTLISATGKTHQIVYHAAPIMDEKDQQQGMILSITDICAMKAAEKLRDASLRETQQLFEGIGDALLVANTNREITLCNPAFTKMLGYTQDEIKGKQIVSVFLDLREYDALEQVLKFQNTERNYQLRIKAQRKDGTVFPSELSVHLIRDEKDDISAYQIVIHDISHRTQVEQALQEAEDRYRSLFENNTIGLYRTSPEGKILMANPTLIKMLGFDSLEDLTKRDLSQDGFQPGYSRSEFITKIESEGSISGLEGKWERADGSPVYIRESARAVRDLNGKTIYYDGAIEDISDKKALEAQFMQSQKMEGIGQLASGIAHDFNNLLSIINGYAEMLLMVSKDKVVQNQVRNIYDAGKRATALTRQLLAFSRNQILDSKVQNLNSLIHNMEKMLSRVLSEQIQLTLELAPDLWNVKVDTSQIEQVLLNLAVNAKDAMPDGGVLRIETSNVTSQLSGPEKRQNAKSVNHILMKVSDTGVGIDPEIMGKVFDPFFTTKSVGKGTGLGLSTVFGIVGQSGGQVYVESQKHVGTTFVIYLPAVQEAVEQLDAVSPKQVAGGSEIILLVEDDPGVKMIAQQILESGGYGVVAVESGVEALRLIEKKIAIDLLLTDVIMPEMNGGQLVEQLLKNNPKLRFIYMSGYTADVISKQGVLDPGVNFIGKPLSPKALLHKVREVLDSKPAMELGAEK